MSAVADLQKTLASLAVGLWNRITYCLRVCAVFVNVVWTVLFQESKGWFYWVYRYWTYFWLRGDNLLLKPGMLNLVLHAVRRSYCRIKYGRMLNAVRNSTSRHMTTAWNFTYRHLSLYEWKFYLKKRQDDYVTMIMIMMICNTFIIHWKRNVYPNRTQAYNFRRNSSVLQSRTCNGHD